MASAGVRAGEPDPFVDPLLDTQRRNGLADELMARRLTRALRNFDEAAIFTIHGFCKRALDDAPFAAGVPLVQELLTDDGELRQEVANDFWRRHVAGGDLSARVDDVVAGPGEIQALSAAFNRMTGDLEAQQAALRTASEEAVGRTRFIETVLSGVSAGVIGVD